MARHAAGRKRAVHAPSRAAWLMLAAFLVPATAAACLWDHDTLPQERSRFPSTLELITGKFLRHSPEFYAWRIEDRKRRLAADPKQLPLYDDLAVAYQKTGRHDLAVETILKKEALQPGLYETYSNLGTFYILAGDFERGLPYIDKALAINPDAHFGREKYQRALVEYAITRRVDGKLVFPLSAEVLDDGSFPDYAAEVKAASDPKAPRKRSGQTFAEYLAQDDRTLGLSLTKSTQAIVGVQGMMRFADHRNPLLLEALAGLLTSVHSPGYDAKQLASRAYLAAAAAVPDGPSRRHYEEYSRSALFMTVDPPDVPSQFAEEQADADAWYAALAAREKLWISTGLNPETLFDALYFYEPSSLDVEGFRLWTPLGMLTAVAGLGVGVALLGMLLRLRGPAKKAATQPTAA